MNNTNNYERYQRQILFSGFGVEGQDKLKQAKVLVVGAGGLGSPVLQYLAGAGIGTLGIVDADVVDLSNLHRQVLHPEERAGMNKAESAAITLQKLNSEISIQAYPFMLTEENAEAILAAYDFTVICVDNFQARFLINDLCVKLKKPFCNGGILEMHGQVMTYVPGKGPCYRCIFEDVPAAGTVPTSADVGVVGPAVGVIGSIQALEVLKYFTGAGDLLTGKMLVFDGLSMTSRIIKMPHPSPDCKVCH
ncbi:MAG: HesA/MoeB/ThiF family protein [Lachnospiraceae bacterium]|nr:HesA/MoeB/ThiF family protein [Lachnospiraceae bacterium]